MSDLWGVNSSDDEDEDDIGSELLAFDDSLDPIERINIYIKSHVVLHRLHLVRDLADTARQIGIEKSVDHIVPVLHELKDDGEPVIRQALVEQVAELAPIFKEGGESGYVKILHDMLPTVAALTTDSNPQVRQSAMEALVEVGKVLEHDHIQPHLLPIVKSLAKDNTEEEHRVEGAQLLNDLAPIMQQQLCTQFAVPHIKTLAADAMFRVRKAVASHMGNICEIVGAEETTSQLLPVFVALASDDIWGVRKACAESLVAVSQNLQTGERADTLTKVFEKLAEDSSRWVRGAAFQALGPFIATFTDGQVPEILLTYYKNMVSDPSKDSPLGDSDNVTYCSFNFPAVLLTLGPGGWPQLSETYSLLTKDGQFKVRRSLAFSLHEIAKILGTELTVAALLPTLEAFLKDLEEVKVGVITNLAKFYEVLSPSIREEYLYVLEDIRKDTNWRFRKLLAKQLGELSVLYSSEIVAESIVPLFLALLQDQVVAVRKPLVRCLGKLAQSLETNQEKRTAFVEQIKALAKESHYQWRQLYAQLCVYGAEQLDKSLFETEFLPSLIELTSDKVPNTRFNAAKAIRRMADLDAWKDNETILELLKKLQADSDQDVKFYATREVPDRLKSYVRSNAK